MAYVPVPKDLSKIKTKVLFNLTQRQLVCFSGGALVGVPLFFLLRDRLGISAAALVMTLVMIPAFLLAVYERNGQPLEKVLRNIVNVVFVRPRRRPYKTNNFYAVLERQRNLDKEVSAIVQKRVVSRGQEGDPGGHRQSQPHGSQGEVSAGQHSLSS